MASDEIGSFASRRQRVAVVMAERFDGLNLTQLAKLQAMVHALQRLTRDASITTVELEEGRMRLTLEGTERAIEQLRQLFANGGTGGSFSSTRPGCRANCV